MPCAAAESPAACGHRFIDSLADRAFRRPIGAEERTRLQALFEAELAASNYAAAIEAVTQAILLAPQFLHRIEVGTRGTGDAEGLHVFDDWELATRLSYALTGFPPDAPLREAAGSGKLTKAGGLAEQARRLLATDQGRTVVRSFFDQWLHVEAMDHIVKDPRYFPAYQPADNARYRDSFRRFVEHTFTKEGTIAALLESKTVFLDARLATLVGYAGKDVSGDELRAIDLGTAPDRAAERAGILTQPGLLAALAHDTIDAPVLRGLFVFERLLCQTAPQPPDGVVTALPEFEPNAPRTTSRKMLELEHETGTACSVCHRAFDPFGFALGHYDGIGAYRTMDAGEAVDAKVTLSGLDDSDAKVTVDGAIELSERLAESPAVASCVSRQWFRYTVGRHEGDGDGCVVDDLVGTLADHQGDMRTLVERIVESPAFRTRAVPSAN